MNYDLAKELMDAGFPQGGKGSWAHPTDAIVIRSGDRVYVPTLEELIEVCGEKLYALIRVESDEWYTETWTSGNKAQVIRAGVLSRTANEAVTCLWLALNAKPIVE